MVPSIQPFKSWSLNNPDNLFFIFKPFTEESVKQLKEYGGWIDEARWSVADNITFDAVVHLKDVEPQEVEKLQRKAYFMTFGRKLLRLIKEEKLRYFTSFIAYMFNGIKDGLDPHYLLPYFHIYGYNHVSK